MRDLSDIRPGGFHAALDQEGNAPHLGVCVGSRLATSLVSYEAEAASHAPSQQRLL